MVIVELAHGRWSGLPKYIGGPPHSPPLRPMTNLYFDELKETSPTPAQAEVTAERHACEHHRAWFGNGK